MPTLTTALSPTSESTDSAYAAAIKIEADGNSTKADAKDRRGICFDARKTPDDFAHDVNTCKQLLELEAVFAGENSRGAAVRAARTKRADQRKIMASTIEELETQARQNDQDLQRAVTKLGAASRAGKELTHIKMENPHLWPLVLPANLDDYTLRCDDTIIGTSDPQSQELEVPVNIFDRESERRRTILAERQAEATARHEDEVRAWRAKHGITREAQTAPNPPIRTQVTWADHHPQSKSRRTNGRAAR